MWWLIPNCFADCLRDTPDLTRSQAYCCCSGVNFGPVGRGSLGLVSPSFRIVSRAQRLIPNRFAVCLSETPDFTSSRASCCCADVSLSWVGVNLSPLGCNSTPSCCACRRRDSGWTSICSATCLKDAPALSKLYACSSCSGASFLAACRSSTPGLFARHAAPTHTRSRRVLPLVAVAFPAVSA